MKVQVIGKKHRQGTSQKSGKPYDCTLVYVTYDGRNVEGQACDSIWLNTSEYPMESIEIGAFYVVERTPKNYVIGFYKLAE